MDGAGRSFLQRGASAVDHVGVFTTIEQPVPYRRGPVDRRVRLVLESGRAVPIGVDQTLVVGTDPTAGLVVQDRYVSFRHAAIRRDGPGFFVEDLGSTNGTFVDGVQVEQAWAGPGSRLRMGNQRIDVVLQHDDLGEGSMIGTSVPFRRMVKQLTRLAQYSAPALITGETGTGKELAARALHDRGPRHDGPFVALNCAAIAEGLAESTLFGHLKGSFTGAYKDRAGAFVEASGGTLFLDEIGELPVALQAKLLRALEVRSVVPVGSEREVAIDVRVVAATHRDLLSMVAQGTFREDLYHRLGVLEVRLPPLRERREDIPLLLERFAQHAAQDVGRRVVLTESAIFAAKDHAWPGNIRQLRNAVLRAAAFADGPITGEDLLPGLTPSPQPSASSSAAESTPRARLETLKGQVRIPKGDYESMRRSLLEAAVQEHGSIRKAAPALGIPRSTLGKWLKLG